MRLFYMDRYAKSLVASERLSSYHPYPKYPKDIGLEGRQYHFYCIAQAERDFKYLKSRKI